MATATSAHEVPALPAQEQQLDTSSRPAQESLLQSLKHTESLNGNAADVWVACKHAVALLPDLAPEYFAKAEFLQGSGGPGSIAHFHFGPAVPGGGSVKHRLDTVDDNSQTMSYTVIEGDGNATSFVSELQFREDGTDKTEATWTLQCEAGNDEVVKQMKTMVVITLKTFARAAMEFKRIVRHTRTLEAPVDIMWNILMHEDVILPKVIPHIIAAFEWLEGNGEPGSIRLLKLGHAIPGGKHVIERIDINDPVTKTWGYTVCQGDPKYKYLSATMQFLPGPEENTTIANWVGVYVPQQTHTPPPDLALSVWKVFENVAKTSPQAVY